MTTVSSQLTPDATVTDRPGRARWLPYGLLAVSTLLALIQAWANRHTMDADAISYMDMGVAISQGHLGEAINGYWSPLYACFVALLLVIFRPPNYYEAMVVHLGTVLIFLFTAVCFHHFWASLRRASQVRKDEGERETGSADGLPEWAWWSIGYALFTWSTLEMISMYRMAPDLWLLGFTYLAAAIVVRIRAGQNQTRMFAWLGLIVAVGFLSKTVMFVLAFGFIGLAGLAAGRWRNTWPRMAVALAVFLGVSAPYVVLLSIKQGHVTYGDVGRIGYALYVSGYSPNYVAHDKAGDNPLFGWQGGIQGLGEPLHPKRVLHTNPVIEEFATPVGGSYPFWYDPSYWYAGMKAPFYPRGQWMILKDSAKALYDIFWGRQSIIIVCFAIMLFGSQSWREAASRLIRQWPVVLPAVGGILLFAALLVLPRYVAGFVVMLWAAVLVSVRVGQTAEAQRFIRAVCVVCLAGYLYLLGECLWPAFTQTALDVRYRADMAPNIARKMTEGLNAKGIGPGDTVGHLGKALKSWSYWASVARVQIVAELRPAEQFFQSSEAEQEKLIDVFRTKTKVKALVTGATDGKPIQAKGWEPIKGTPFYVYLLQR
jgi:hypothetical protein